MRSDNQIIDGIYKLCYNINIVCGANGRVAFLSSKAKTTIRAQDAPFLHVSDVAHLVVPSRKTETVQQIFTTYNCIFDIV